MDSNNLTNSAFNYILILNGDPYDLMMVAFHVLLSQYIADAFYPSLMESPLRPLFFSVLFLDCDCTRIRYHLDDSFSKD